MPMCLGMFDQWSSSSTEFCDKNQMDIDHIIDPLSLCQYNICSFIFCFALWLQFLILETQFQSELHTRSTIINPRLQHGLQAALSSSQVLCTRPFNYCVLGSGKSLIRWRCTGFLQWDTEWIKKTQLLHIKLIWQKQSTVETFLKGKFPEYPCVNIYVYYLYNQKSE